MSLCERKAFACNPSLGHRAEMYGLEAEKSEPSLKAIRFIMSRLVQQEWRDQKSFGYEHDIDFMCVYISPYKSI